MKVLPAILLVLATSVAVVHAQRGAVEPFEQSAFTTPRNGVDQAVFAQLDARKIPAAQPCSDAVFLRRVHLDLLGTVPTPAEAAAFLADTTADKRARLIDRLLERPEFADFWAMHWCDQFRVKSEFPVNLWPNAVQAYHRWVRDSIRDNKPYDVFARELLTSSGSNFREPAVNFYRAVENHEPPALAKAAALVFLGSRIEKWPEDRQAGFAAFFARVAYKSTSEWKEEIIFFDPTRICTNPAVAATPRLPDGGKARLKPDQDPREALADWLTGPGRETFAQVAANRIWFWATARGIVHEPDDFRADNPPANPELLAYLGREFIAAKYDTKALLRLILNSRTYQLSSIPASDDPDAERLFAHSAMRRLDAEVLIDALCQITGTTEEYSSAIPEPFTFIPKGERAVNVADGSITSPFLALFGRAPRDTGLLAERNNQSTWSQRLHLLNSTHVRRKLESGPKLVALYGMASKSPRQMADQLYLTFLSRRPTEDEWKTIVEYRKTSGLSDRNAGMDVAWALVNSPEFLHRH